MSASRCGQHRQPAAERRLHMLARRDVHFDQPFERQIAAPGGGHPRRCRARYWRAGRRGRGRRRGRASPRRRARRPSPPPSCSRPRPRHDSNSAAGRPRCAAASPRHRARNRRSDRRMKRARHRGFGGDDAERVERRHRRSTRPASAVSVSVADHRARRACGSCDRRASCRHDPARRPYRRSARHQA